MCSWGHGGGCLGGEVKLTDGGDCGNDLSQFELVKDGGLSGSVQTHHQNPHLFLPKEIFKQICKHVPHFD